MCKLVSLSGFWTTVTCSKTSPVRSQQESFTLPGKYSQDSSCKRFILSCQFRPSHQKWFVITSMICIASVSVLAKLISENKTVFQDSYQGSYLLMRSAVVILGVIIWQASKLQVIDAWSNLFISLRSINKTQSPFNEALESIFTGYFSQHLL